MVRDSALVAFNRIFRNIIAVIFVIIIARLFSKYQYGTYRQCMLIANTTNLLVLFGVSEILTYHYRTYDQINKGSLITSVIIMKVFFAIISVISLFLIKDFLIREMGNNSLENLYLITVIITVIIIFSSAVEGMYISAGKVFFMTAVTVITYILYYVLAVIIVVKTSNVFNVLLLFAIFEAARVLFMYLYFIYSERLRLKIDHKMIITIIKFAAPIALASIVVALNREVDKLLVSFFFHTTKFAEYNNAAATLPIIEFITISVGMVIFPKMVQIKNEAGLQSAVELFKKAAGYTCMVMYPIMLFLLFFGESYIVILFSPKYIGATDVFRIYILRMIITFACFSNLIILIDKKRLLIYTTLISLSLNIILSYVLIISIGMEGAAIASLIVQLFTDSFLVFLVMRNSVLKFRDIVNVNINIKALVISAVSIGTGFLFTKILSFGLVSGFLIAGIISVILIITGYRVFGMLSAGEIKRLIGRNNG